MSITAISPSGHDRLGEGAAIYDGRYFNKYYGGRRPQAYSLLLSTIVRFGKPGAILDLGCGTGLFVELAATWNMCAKGLDGSAAAIAEGNRRFPSLDLEHHDLSKPLPFDAEAYDNLMLNQVIAHIRREHAENLFNECRRVLKPNGMLFIFSNSRRNYAAIEKDKSQISPWVPSELRAQLGRCGFGDIIEENSSLRFQSNRILRAVSSIAMRTSLQDRISATANARARRL